MAFQQAGIEVQKVAEFEQLKAAIERAFSPESVAKFLETLESKGVRVRQFEVVLEKKLLEKTDPQLKGAKGLYQALAVSDQALIRERYLALLEQVDPAVRTKFQKLYASY